MVLTQLVEGITVLGSDPVLECNLPDVMVALVLNIKDHSIMRGRKKVPVYLLL